MQGCNHLWALIIEEGKLLCRWCKDEVDDDRFEKDTWWGV